MARLLSVSSSRADVGILSPVWQALVAGGVVDLHVLLTGMHCAADAPKPALPEGVTVHQAGADLGGYKSTDASDAMAEILAVTGACLEQIQPDGLFVIGDRLDMIPATLAALPFGVPIAHLHGGEETEGAIDNRIRHAISQLAECHFASTEAAAQHLQAMAVPAAHIHVTGAPGLDSLRAAEVMDAGAFKAAVGLPLAREFALVTVHPETMPAMGEDVQAPLDAVLAGLDVWDGAVLFTAPNSDPGGAAMRATLRQRTDRVDDWVFVDTLGSKLYPNALRLAAFQLGNSSSGVIEAGLFGLPVIDVGDRQKGRARGGNVTHVPNDGVAVAAAITSLERSADGEITRYAPCTPYGDGRSGPCIARLLAAWLDRKEPKK